MRFGPPLFCSGPSLGSVLLVSLGWFRPQVAVELRLYPALENPFPKQLPIIVAASLTVAAWMDVTTSPEPLFPTTVLATKVAGPATLTPPPEFPVMVLFVNLDRVLGIYGGAR